MFSSSHGQGSSSQMALRVAEGWETGVGKTGSPPVPFSARDLLLLSVADVLLERPFRRRADDF